jgi:RND family efflux transporter MFP subunit
VGDLLQGGAIRLEIAQLNLAGCGKDVFACQHGWEYRQQRRFSAGEKPAPPRSDLDFGGFALPTMRVSFRIGLIASARIASVSSALLLAACSGGGEGAAAGGPGGANRRPPQLVAAQIAGMEDFAPTLIALGTVTPRQSVAVRPRADGEIVAIAFKECDTVRAGQLLFRLDSRQAQASLQQARAALATAVATEIQMRADYERAQALVGKGFISGTVLDQRRAAADAARVQTQLSFLTVTAPISGRTGELAFRLGANIRQGDAALVTINQLSPIHVRFLVPAADVPQARALLGNRSGARVVARAQGSGDVLATGRLVFLDNNVDPGNGGVTARAEFANGDEGLWPGAIVNVEFPLGAARPHIALPEGAVQTGRDAPFVWAVKAGGAPPAAAGGPNAAAGPGRGGPGGKVEMRDVTIAGRLGGKVYLASGLQPGERVVVDALARLKEGDTVRLKGPDNKPRVAGAAATGPSTGPSSGSAG